MPYLILVWTLSALIKLLEGHLALPGGRGCPTWVEPMAATCWSRLKGTDPDRLVSLVGSVT